MQETAGNPKLHLRTCQECTRLFHDSEERSTAEVQGPEESGLDPPPRQTPRGK
jgi:hypothetical protein